MQDKIPNKSGCQLQNGDILNYVINSLLFGAINMCQCVYTLSSLMFNSINFNLGR